MRATPRNTVMRDLRPGGSSPWIELVSPVLARSLDGADPLVAAVTQARHNGRWVHPNCPDRSWCMAALANSPGSGDTGGPILITVLWKQPSARRSKESRF